ncbi:uncharacterized protein LOC106163446 [Lingula anatina]|uniref:Uncharacterized protein LOC106163446 n=1 Tax=Lingula anatina TaxID=7574 RepID=A0A1S3IEA0_LINAN|nr:uncharacterized protein LOC106163446 [Lingula anatina]|eukprot:XP_013396483.1 uncharacterized protein LOC106163446 [Lingula anatina]
MEKTPVSAPDMSSNKSYSPGMRSTTGKEAMLGQSRQGVNPRSGQVTVQTQPPHHPVSLEKAECMHSFSAKLEDDRGTLMHVTGLAIHKEQLFVVDYGNNRTKVFTHKGQFKFDIKLNRPWDVAVSQTGQLYITSTDDKCVKVYSTRGQQVTTMGHGLLEVPCGITLNGQGHVMVCDRGKRSIFTFHADSGQLLNTIPLSMCGDPAYITVNSVNDNIVLSDWLGHCVHVLSPTGDQLWQYGTHGRGVGKLKSPHGVYTDSYGHIFVVDCDNHRIVALSPQGQFIRYIVTKDGGLKLPSALAINPAGQLVVGDLRGKVKTFKFIQPTEGQFSEEINKQEPLLQEAYQRACKDGFERVKRARVMLLGHYGAGKTHLRKRLLGKEYDEENDPITNGIETDYVLVKEGWNSDDAECHGPAISRLLAVNTKKIHEEIRASHTDPTEKSQPLGQGVEAIAIQTSEIMEKSSSKPPGKQSAVNQEEIIAEHQPSPSSSKEALSHLKTEESMELPPDVLTHLTQSLYDIENPPARLAIWDFGGQSVYYNTHHTFLSSRAIYILAIDMSLALTDRPNDQWHGAENFSGTILGFTDYWIDAIHTYAAQQDISEDGVSCPRIIIVCTHKDKYLENVPKEKHEVKINAYIAKLRQHIQQKRSGVHVDPRFFAIDNTCQDEDPEISDLRRYVMKVAESQKSWGEKNPIRWINLEEDLQLRRAPEKRGKRWIRHGELQKLAVKVGMQDASELKSFLQFHHDIGDLMHFQTDDLSDTVILNPLWLVHAFRSIIAVDKHHVKAKGTPYWSALKRGILDERLLDELLGDDSELKPILIDVMVRFNILLQQDVKPGTTEKPTSRQFYVPSLLQICKNPESGVGSEGTIFIQGKENFMPHVLFSRLTVELVQNDTSPRRKVLRRRGDFFLIKNELYYDYAVYAIDLRRGARCALRKSTKSSSIELIPLYPPETKFDRTIREAYAKWKNHVFMQIQQVKQTVCPHLQLEWFVRDPRKPKIKEELMAIDPKETDLTACELPVDSVYRLWFMPNSSEKEHGVTPPATKLSSDDGEGNDDEEDDDDNDEISSDSPTPTKTTTTTTTTASTRVTVTLPATGTSSSSRGSVKSSAGNRKRPVHGHRHIGMSQNQTSSELPAPPQTRHSDALKNTFLRRFSIPPEGGSVHLKEVGVFLLVPPGALTETTEMFIGISWREEDMPPLPPCQTRASHVVVCGPHGLTFRTPVYLSFYHCISGTRQRKMGKICPEHLTQNSRMDNPFYIWQSETHLNDPCQWKVLSSASVVLTNTKCVLIVNQFCKHSLSCDSKRLSALVFGSFHLRPVALLNLMICCVNDTRDEVENVITRAKASLSMDMLAMEKKFHFLTCEYSESEQKDSYDVSLSLLRCKKEWNMHDVDHRKVIKYVKLLKNDREDITYALSPKMTEGLDVFVCQIHIKQELSEDQEEDIKELTSTEFNIHWMLPRREESLPSCYRNAEEDRHGSTPVYGKILLSMEYDYKNEWLTVRIHRCQDLAPVDVKKNRSDIYVKTYLLPDKPRVGKRKTKIRKNTLNPIFDETVHYNITKNELERRFLWLSVLGKVTFGHNESLGELLLPLNKQNFGDTSPQWFQLSGGRVAAGDQGITDPQTTRRTENQVLDQAHMSNQLQNVSTSLKTPLQPNFGNQQDDFQSQTTRKMVAQGQYQQIQPSLQPYFGNQWLQQSNFQFQTLPGESAGQNKRYHQEGQSQHSRLPQVPVTDNRLEEHGDDHFQTMRKSGYEFASLPPQQDPVAAEDRDQGFTGPPIITTTANQVLTRVPGDNQLQRSSRTVAQENAGVLRQTPTNTGNTTNIYNVQYVYHNYGTDEKSMPQMKEKDVTTSFYKHVPPRVRKRLYEAFCQVDVWNQVKKMYGISDDTPCPPDVVSLLLSQVHGSIASFISELLKLKESLRERQQYSLQDLIDEVKDGLKSEMEYKKLRQNKILFAEELYIDIGRILDYFNQDDKVPDEEITVLKNTAKENPRDACRKLFERLIANSPEKQLIRYLKHVLRQCKQGHLADELEVSHQDVEDELQKHEAGGDQSSRDERLAVGVAAPPTPVTDKSPIGAH